MADIKIDEVEYFVFLNTIKSFIEELSEEAKENSKSKSILSYVDSEFGRRDLMRERKMYYDFYVNNRYSKPEEAKQAYQKYIDIKIKLKKKEKK